MKCPVCKTECHENSTCPECGFNEVGRVFVNKEDGQEWLRTVVYPFQDAYAKKVVLGPLNWLEIFKQKPQMKAFFEVTIPAARKKQSELEYLSCAPMGGDIASLSIVEERPLVHIALKSTNEVVDTRIVEEVYNAVGRTGEVKRVTLNGTLKSRDLANILVNIDSNSVVVFDIAGKIKKEVCNIMPQTLSKYVMPLTIGKGASAASIHLDLPVFTSLFIANKIKDIPDVILDSVDAIIEPSFSKEDLLEYQIRELADSHKVLLTMTTLKVLKEQLNAVNARTAMKFLADYLFLHPEIDQPLSSNEMLDIVKKIC